MKGTLTVLPQARCEANAEGRKERDGFKWAMTTKPRVFFTCVEVTCVAVKIDDDSVQVRDIKDPTGPTLTFTLQEWRAFIEFVKNGEFET